MVAKRLGFLVVTLAHVRLICIWRPFYMTMDGSRAKLATEGRPLQGANIYGIQLVLVQRSIRFGGGQPGRTVIEMLRENLREIIDVWPCLTTWELTFGSRTYYHYHWWCSAFAWDETSGDSDRIEAGTYIASLQLLSERRYPDQQCPWAFRELYCC